MAQKPPAFQFYVKDWRSSATVRRMNFHQRGLYIEMLAASWDSEEPGTLPLPLEIASRSIGCDIRSLRDFLTKFPNCFQRIEGTSTGDRLDIASTSDRSRVEVASKSDRYRLDVTPILVNDKMRMQWLETLQYLQMTSDRGRKGAAKRWHSTMQEAMPNGMHNDSSASASASASAFKPYITRGSSSKLIRAADQNSKPHPEKSSKIRTPKGNDKMRRVDRLGTHLAKQGDGDE